MLDALSAVASVPDLLRLVAVPFFGWAAYRDVRTRRVPNRSWLPLALLGVALLAWEVWLALDGQLIDPELFLLRVALSLGMVAPIGYLFYWFGGFGGADAKALIVLAVLFPAFPTYYLPGLSLPLHVTTVGVFSLTILSNTVLAGAIYPVAVMARNAVHGRVCKAMFVGHPVPTAELPRRYGSLAETPDGFTRRGLDLDALRMYLRWRGATLADLRADPDRHRDPASLPDEPNPPGDGTVDSDGPDPAADVSESPDEPVADGGDAAPGSGGSDYDDPWGAQAFLDDIEGNAYGTTPETLREGLEVVAAEDEVWITPGMPFIVPMFLGLLLSLVYGDVLVTAIAAVT